MENYKETAEKTMLEMRQAKELNDRILLNTEIVMCSISVAFMLVLDLMAAYMDMPDWLRAVLIVVSFLQLIPCVYIALKIEQKAGYYMCKKCGHHWVPEYKQVFFAPHVGRSRKMTCPNCGKFCYHKKVLTKDE